VEQAGLVPMPSHISMFQTVLHEYKEKNDLHDVLKQFNAMARLKGDFFLCKQSAMESIARELARFDLPIEAKYRFCLSPVNLHDSGAIRVITSFARKLALGEVPGFFNFFKMERVVDFDGLAKLCSVYNHIELFMWLQNKFPPPNIVEQQTALARREWTTNVINKSLVNSERLKLKHSYLQRDRDLREKARPSKSPKGFNQYPQDDQVGEDLDQSVDDM
jgi:hypothetical protein